MSKYVYPAVFTKEDNGQYSVVFRDLEGCYTCGESMEQAIEMAEALKINFSQVLQEALLQKLGRT